MHIQRYILLILICLLIQSCASSIDTQRLQGGKVSFMSGDFKSAFHQLLPLAAEGIPQAEYGVGYLYYYGYGVTQDSESGIFWMNKAATARYAPAIRALAAIEENRLKQEETHHSPAEPAPLRTNAIQGENNKLEKDAVLEALNQTAPPKQGHVTLMPQPDEITAAKTTAQEFNKVSDDTIAPALSSTTAKKYTLQLLGSYSLSALKQRQAALNLNVPTYIGQTKHNGRDWYVLTYGQYSALGHAGLAKFDLPKKIKELKPWIRKCDELTWVS